MPDTSCCPQCEEKQKRIDQALNEIEVVLALLGDWESYPCKRLRETYVALRGWMHPCSTST
jgi:hypothetical protein